MTEFEIEEAKVYGLNLRSARRGPDQVLRADICPPLTTGHWEYTADRGWVHFDAAE